VDLAIGFWPKLDTVKNSLSLASIVMALAIGGMLNSVGNYCCCTNIFAIMKIHAGPNCCWFFERKGLIEVIITKNLR